MMIDVSIFEVKASDSIGAQTVMARGRDGGGGGGGAESGGWGQRRDGVGGAIQTSDQTAQIFSVIFRLTAYVSAPHPFSVTSVTSALQCATRDPDITASVS